MLVFLVLRFLIQTHIKFLVFDKIKSFKEFWRLDVYKLDQYVYWRIINIIQYLSVLGNVKLILLINWWVLVFLLVLI
jgi:hypothetical protein